MSETAPQFAWRCLARGEFAPRRRVGGQVADPGAVCWLCGGETGGQGWPWREAVAETFTNHALAVASRSTTVCQACAAFASKLTWEQYVADHPEKGLKTGHAVAWRCYSHVFAAGLHDCPTRARWREWLLRPPEPPFLFVVATSGQKNLIFRGRIAHSRAIYPVLFEEQQLVVNRARFAECLTAFERLYELGFSKESIASGRYHQGQIMTVGLGVWRPAEEALALWRQQTGYLALAHFCAQRSEEAKRGLSVRHGQSGSGDGGAPGVRGVSKPEQSSIPHKCRNVGADRAVRQGRGQTGKHDRRVPGGTQTAFEL